jgi:hypothetical protein
VPEAQRWYVAVLILRRAREPGSADAIGWTDHRLVLLHAPDGETAYERALFMGRARAAEWHWEFAGLHDLRAVGRIDRDARGRLGVITSIENIADGCEVYTFKLPEDRAWPVLPKRDLTEFWDPSRGLDGC